MGLRDRSMDVDLEKMKTLFLGPGDLAAARYYSGLGFSPSALPFFSKLKQIGYEVCCTNENVVTGKPAPVDAMLLTDLCLFKDQYDVAYVVSGDGDFAYAIENLATRFEKKIVIIASRSNISLSLKRLARDYPSRVRVFLLEDHYQEFCMRRISRNKVR